MSTVKCVNLGLPKSGTTSFAYALTQAGWLVADHKVRRMHTKDPHLGGTFVGRQIYNGYYQDDPFKFLDLYDALSEISVLNETASFWPQCDYAVLKAMRVARPNMLFVATWRPPQDIADSMRRWNNLASERIPKGNIPGLPHDFGAKSADRLRWIEGHYDMLRDLFGDDPRYLELPMEAEDARDRLAAHIGKTLPWWGRKNVNNKQAAQDASSGRN